MKKRYIIRYDNNHFIETINVNNEVEKNAVVNMIETLGYEYVVIASKENKDSNFSISCMLQFKEFNTDKRYY